jgi:hypothetical protein
MSVGIPNSNPAYSLDSVLQSQVREFTQPNPAPAAPAAPPPGLATYNNLGANAGSGPSAGQLPTVTPPPAPPPNAPKPAGGADLATSTTASVLTSGGTVSVTPVAGSAAQITFTNSSNGDKSVIGTVSAGLTTNVNGTNVTSGNLTTNDVGVFASTQGAPKAPGTFDQAISVRSGATQGSATSPGVTSDQQQQQAQQVSFNTLVSANTDAGHLSSFISQFA